MRGKQPSTLYFRGGWFWSCNADDGFVGARLAGIKEHLVGQGLSIQLH